MENQIATRCALVIQVEILERTVGMVGSQNKKLAVVTGASRGIGRAIAGSLAEDGFHVVLLARNSGPLDLAAKELVGLGFSATPIVCDVTSSKSILEAVSEIEGSLGAPAVLVNNAGQGGPFHRADEVSEEEWNYLFSCNMDSVFHFCKWALPLMKKNGFGRIVNISSIFGLVGGAQSSTYAATKHAMIGYTKSIAMEWGAYGITANAVCPGYINTEMLANNPDQAMKDGILRRIPVGRFGEAEEIGKLVSFLVGAHGGFVNGSQVVIDGGMIAG